MVTFAQRVSARVLAAMMRRFAVCSVEGVALVDARVKGRDESFRKTISASLLMIRDQDPRQFARLKRCVHFVINEVNPSGAIAEYDEALLACKLEFVAMPDLDNTLVAAAYACVLVHEVTHGTIAARGIDYTPATRARIEQICAAQQRRFARKLAESGIAPRDMEELQDDFDPVTYERIWTNAGSFRQRLSYLRRVFVDAKPEPGASPNGDPATRPGNSGAGGGPPSVS